MAIYAVGMELNVEADSSEHAFRKTLDHLKKTYSGEYEEISRPTLLKGITADDCETLIQ
jgi:hypothetical protein